MAAFEKKVFEFDCYRFFPIDNHTEFYAAIQGNQTGETWDKIINTVHQTIDTSY